LDLILPAVSIGLPASRPAMPNSQITSYFLRAHPTRLLPISIESQFTPTHENHILPNRHQASNTIKYGSQISPLCAPLPLAPTDISTFSTLLEIQTQALQYLHIAAPSGHPGAPTKWKKKSHIVPRPTPTSALDAFENAEL